jgi:hypothetical protein
MNLLQELIPFPERVLGYVKRLQQRDYDIGLHALHGWSRFMWPDCIDSKGAILKIDTPTNIISNYDKTIYNVRTRNTHQLIQDLKEYLANTVYMPLVSTFIISIKCRFQSRCKDLSRKQKSFWNNHQKSITTIEDVLWTYNFLARFLKPCRVSNNMNNQENQ